MNLCCSPFGGGTYPVVVVHHVLLLLLIDGRRRRCGRVAGHVIVVGRLRIADDHVMNGRLFQLLQLAKVQQQAAPMVAHALAIVGRLWRQGSGCGSRSSDGDR